MSSDSAPAPTAAVVAKSAKRGKDAVKKNNNNSTPVMAQDCKPPSSAEDQDDLLIVTPANISSDQGTGIAPGQLITPSLSAEDQNSSLLRDEMSTVGSDHIAMDTLDETKDDDNTTSSQQGEGSENKNTGDDEEEKSGGDVDSSLILQSQSESQSQEESRPNHHSIDSSETIRVDPQLLTRKLLILQSQSESQAQKESRPNHHSIDTPEKIRADPQLLTRKLLASGGDIRALLSSDQPLSSLRAQTVDTGKEGAGQQIASKDEETEEDEEVQEEPFVRPPRLRFALSKEAASDGFPSAIALSLRWHPDHMQDRPEDAANLSMRAAFDTKFDEYYVFRHWRPSQGW